MIMYHSRGKEKDQRIISRFSPPIIKDDYLTKEELREFYTFQNYTLDDVGDGIYSCLSNEKKIEIENTTNLILNLSNRIKEEFLIENCYLSCWDLVTLKGITPPHTDAEIDKSKEIYKQVMIPLAPKIPSDIIFFDQRFLGPQIKFVNNEKIDEEVNISGLFYIIDSGKLLNESKIPFNPPKGLGHRNKESLQGLSIDKIIETKINKLILWDQAQLHASSDWNLIGINSKVLLLLRYSIK